MGNGFDPTVGSEDEIEAGQRRRFSKSPEASPRGFTYDSVIVLCGDENYKMPTLEIFKRDYGFLKPFVLTQAGGAGLLHPDCRGPYAWEREKVLFAVNVAKTFRLGLAIHQHCLGYGERGFFDLAPETAVAEVQKKHLYELSRFFDTQAINVTALLPYKNEGGVVSALPVFPRI